MSFSGEEDDSSSTTSGPEEAPKKPPLLASTPIVKRAVKWVVDLVSRKKKPQSQLVEEFDTLARPVPAPPPETEDWDAGLCIREVVIGRGGTRSDPLPGTLANVSQPGPDSSVRCLARDVSNPFELSEESTLSMRCLNPPITPTTKQESPRRGRLAASRMVLSAHRPVLSPASSQRRVSQPGQTQDDSTRSREFGLGSSKELPSPIPFEARCPPPRDMPPPYVPSTVTGPSSSTVPQPTEPVSVRAEDPSAATAESSGSEVMFDATWGRTQSERRQLPVFSALTSGRLHSAPPNPVARPPPSAPPPYFPLSPESAQRRLQFTEPPAQTQFSQQKGTTRQRCLPAPRKRYPVRSPS